jgi:hypothetical protein
MQIELSQQLKAREKELKETILAAVYAFEKDTLLTVSTLNIGIITRETRAGTIISGGKSLSIEYML